MFYLGDFAIDRMVGLVAEQNDEIAYILKQCQSGTIDVSAESNDTLDKSGALVRRSYSAKTAEISITNAMLNINAMNAASGSAIDTATESAPIDMPKFIPASAGSTVTIEDLVEGTIRVKEFSNNGATGASVSMADDGVATETEYGWDAETHVLSLPTASGKKYVVKFMRTRKTGAVIKNETNKFPGGVELTIKALYIDPCYTSGVKACYIYCPNFQASPETSIPLGAGETFDFSGSLATSYCDDEKVLYKIYFPDEDDEDIL